MDYKVLNEQQSELLTKFCSSTVMNNLEIHASDMPQVIEMFRLISSKGYVVSDTQVDVICDSLHSLANRDVPTSDELRQFLHNVATIFSYTVIHPNPQPFKRPLSRIADDIISEKEVEYSETS